MVVSLKLGCVTDIDMLVLVTGLISLVDEIQFMLISSRHICLQLCDHFLQTTFYNSFIKMAPNKIVHRLLRPIFVQYSINIMNPITSKNSSKLAILPSFIAIG